VTTIIVRYQPRPDSVGVNQQLIEDVFIELAEVGPDGLRYDVWRLADGTFLHLAEIGGSGNPLLSLPAFQRFSADIDQRCEPDLGPNAQTATLIGTYPAAGGRH
jgi:hypothetical protein